MEHLHDNKVSPVLQFVRTHISRGVVDEAWYDEQLVLLLARTKSHQQRLLEQVERIALIRPATRREVYRRICSRRISCIPAMRRSSTSRRLEDGISLEVSLPP